MKKVLILLSFITIATAATAQRRENQMWFKHAIGFRYELLHAGMCAASYERFWSKHNSWEAMAGWYFAEGLEVAGFYKYTSTFPGLTRQFRWFMGPGVHIASWFDKKPQDDPFVFGLDALFGLGFIFYNIPVAISVDWRPQMDLYTQDGEKQGVNYWRRFDPNKLGITFRYTMKYNSFNSNVF